MRIIISFILSAMFATSFLGTEGVCKDMQSDIGSKESRVFATNQCFAKGGVGIINENLYITLNSTKNGLIVDPGNQKWMGQSASEREVVLFFDGKVLPPSHLPDGFDLSKSVVISFEQDKVRFFNYKEMSGGFYMRKRL